MTMMPPATMAPPPTPARCEPTADTIQGIQYDRATDEHGNIIHISQATRHIKYRCTNCNDVLIPRMGDINQHHYAHQNKECDLKNYRETLVGDPLEGERSATKSFWVCPGGSHHDQETMDRRGQGQDSDGVAHHHG